MGFPDLSLTMPGRIASQSVARRRLRDACASPLPVLLPGTLLLVLLSASRAGLVWFYRERLTDVADLGRLFLIGLRIDVALVSYLSFLPLLLLPLLDTRAAPPLRRVLASYWALVFGFAVFMELATIPFLGEFDLRPNRLFFEYGTHVREVFGTVWSEHGATLLLVVALSVLTGVAIVRVVGGIISARRPTAVSLRALSVVTALPLLFLGARGTLDHRPINISTAAFSNNQLANQLALDSSYSLLYAVYSLRHETDPARVYGTMPEDEMLSIVRNAARIDSASLVSGRGPLNHRQPSHHASIRRYNLVIILEESLGAEFVGCLGGLPLTPKLDRLSQDGMLLRNLYATGVRTVRGIEAVVAGFPPTPGRAVVKLDRSQHGFFTLASLLAEQGYETEFVYGGRSHFDNMRSFLRGNGFARIYDEPTFPDTGFHGIWGVSDEDLFLQADRIFRGHGGRPFFGLILTTSNHAPFEFPAGRIELYEQPQNTRLNAMKYADYALGRFFELASQSDYYAETIFLIVADHNTRTYGNDLVPIAKFRVPGLILGPGVPTGPYDGLASQLDLGPTLLDLMGVDVAHPMIGRSLVGPVADRPDRAIMQFGTSNAYMRGDQVVVLQPTVAAMQFAYKGQRLVPARSDPELVREALAHAILPGWLYSNRLYR